MSQEVNTETSHKVVELGIAALAAAVALRAPHTLYLLECNLA